MEQTTEKTTEQTTDTKELAKSSPQPLVELEKPKPKSKPKAKKKKHTKLIVWSIVVLVIVGYIGYSMFAAANYIPAVKAGEISYQQINTYLSTTATIAAPESISYFAPPQSKAIEVNFKVGDIVKKGDIIAAFDLTDLQDDIRMAQLDLADANINVTKLKDSANRQKTVDELNAEIADANSSIAALQNRIIKYDRDELDSGDATDRETWQRRITSLQAEVQDLSAQLGDYPKAPMSALDVQSAQNTVAKAALKLKSLQKYQDDKGMIAEADGIITQMNLIEGAPASNTTVACVIDSTANLTGKFNIGKYDIGSIKIGQAVTLSLGSLQYEGTISKIGSVAVKTVNSTGASTAATIPAEIAITNPDESLVVGLDFDVEIHTFENANALAIPVEAILTDRGGDFCYKLIASEKPELFTYEKIYITTGNASEDYVEVLDGITAGERIVISPPTTMEMLPIVKVLAETPITESTPSTSEAPAV